MEFATYHIRLFEDFNDACIQEIQSPIIPHIGESFFLGVNDGWFLVKEVVYNDLDDLYMIDLLVEAKKLENINCDCCDCEENNNV